MLAGDVQIIEYNPLYKNDFVKLNEEWIKHYFKLENQDIALFSNPEMIVQNGGNIFFALYGNEVVGTVALIKENESKYEIAKMAVSLEYRGKSIGKKLLLHVIDYARKNNYKYLYLISNTKLIPAIKLYEKLGFQQIPVENNHYERGDYRAEIFL
jgi:ribosomal protein S18 acetylase RimI-like enzyme